MFPAPGLPPQAARSPPPASARRGIRPSTTTGLSSAPSSRLGGPFRCAGASQAGRSLPPAPHRPSCLAPYRATPPAPPPLAPRPPAPDASSSPHSLLMPRDFSPLPTVALYLPRFVRVFPRAPPAFFAFTVLSVDFLSSARAFFRPPLPFDLSLDLSDFSNLQPDLSDPTLLDTHRISPTLLPLFHRTLEAGCPPPRRASRPRRLGRAISPLSTPANDTFASFPGRAADGPRREAFIRTVAEDGSPPRAFVGVLVVARASLINLAPVRVSPFLPTPASTR